MTIPSSQRSKFMEDKSSKTDRDLLVETANNVAWIKMLLQNHLKEHNQFRVIAYSALLTAFGSLLLTILL